MRTKKHVLSLALGLSFVTVAPAAFAQEFGTKGDAVFAGERLFGFTSTHYGRENPGPADDFEFDRSNFSLGWRGTVFGPYEVPRFAFDFLVIDSLSIGGSLGFASVGGDDPNGTAVLFAPRVGYVHMFNDVIGIWPRGGFTYHSESIDNAGDTNGFGLTLECMFPITPTEHFGFLVGPTLDLDITGNFDPDGPGDDVDQTYTTFGIQAGVFGWL